MRQLFVDLMVMSSFCWSHGFCGRSCLFHMRLTISRATIFISDCITDCSCSCIILTAYLFLFIYFLFLVSLVSLFWPVGYACEKSFSELVWQIKCLYTYAKSFAITKSWKLVQELKYARGSQQWELQWTLWHIWVERCIFQVLLLPI